MPTPVFTTGVSSPFGLAVDTSGNIYIANYGNQQVIKETLQGSGTCVRSYLGSALSDVWGIAVDSSGNLFVASDETVHKLILSEGTYTSYTIHAASGASTAFVGATLDSSGDLFLASDGQNQFHKLTPTGPPAATTTCTLTDFTLPSGTAPYGSSNSGHASPRSSYA